MYTEGIVLQQSNLVDSTVTLHLHLVVRNKRWNSLEVEQNLSERTRMLVRFKEMQKHCFTPPQQRCCESHVA